MKEIECWAKDPKKPPVFWLNGLAGTGKTTIAKSIAERMFADGCLGASFFCSRDFEDRSNLNLIFPTLAFQLAQKYSEFRSSLIRLLQSDPDITYESLQSQMQKLLVGPLQYAGISTVIVIDALDECKDEGDQSAILVALAELVSEIPGVKFFITGRPETHIVGGVRGALPKESTDIFILHEVRRYTVDNDIRRFLESELSKLPRRPQGWPTGAQLDSLCQRAAGFFVYAIATVNFLKHKFRCPSKRLDIIMKSPESTTHEGQVGLKAYGSLDSLYMSILQTAFLEKDLDDDTMIRSILGAVILVINPLSPSSIATLVGIECGEVLPLLESIQSLLALHDDTNHPIQSFHKSFPDFITDATRCNDHRFYISPDHHTKLLLHCLDLMGKTLEKNMYSLPYYALNSEVENLPKKIKESSVCGALEYACRSWYNHLLARKPEDEVANVVSALHHFLEKKFLFWLEVLSVLGVLGDAKHALDVTVEWLNEVCLD